jgi:hypothetical protein
MQLKTYREENDLTVAEILKRLADVGLNYAISTITRHETGEREPPIRTIEAYRRITKGAVTYDDWAALAEQARLNRPISPPKGANDQ